MKFVIVSDWKPSIGKSISRVFLLLKKYFDQFVQF